ncbi:Ent-kaurene oxidase [Rhypophila decipiens]|uniref:Ent-kaurene oxidase n=1 Tax=Rhypophila decipiens TaxID=261697 RepID=A0AAN7BBM4_9PEZI|nr:Ent-kaurene oxidase [Rhypophila decipiens]
MGAFTGISVQLLESLTLGRLFATLFLLTLGSFVVDIITKPRYPKSIPHAGNGDGLVGKVKNGLGYITQYNDWAAEGYEKYAKKGRSYVIPAAPSRPSDIVIPRSQTAWLLELPDHLVSTKEAHRDMLHNDHQFFRLDDQFPIRTVHKHLTRHLAGFIPGVELEIRHAIDAVFGLETENWKSINLWEAWLGIVPQVTNRVLIGTPTCRDREFLDGQIGFADAIVTNSFILNMFPSVLHPIVARLVSITNWRHWRKAHKVIKPVIEKCLHDMARKEAGDPAYDSFVPEESLITWLIRQAMAEGLSEELTPERISKRLLPVEFAAIHTTVLTGHTLMLDLLTSDPKLNCLDAIREETTTVFREEGESHWTKQSLSKLHRTDSAIKESMRISTFATGLTRRKVVAKEGVTNEQEGWHAPYGSFLMLNMAGTHHDADLYENPNTYDAFRFSRQREEYEARAEDVEDPEADLKAKRLGMVTTSDSYLSFSHGRHACPGRFFVAHELKMILAYLTQNYEIKHIAERPQPMWIGQTIVPPLDVRIEIKRRKGTV